jgi:hypothetical protein
MSKEKIWNVRDQNGDWKADDTSVIPSITP